MYWSFLRGDVMTLDDEGVASIEDEQMKEMEKAGG
jgi:hypothetical protein